MAISTIGTDALAASAVTTTKLASGVPSRSQLPAGTVLQVQYAQSTADSTITSSSFIDVLTVSITPTSASSTILLLGTLRLQNANTPSWAAARFYNSTAASVVAGGSNYYFYNGAGNTIMLFPLNYITTAGSTSARTYALQVASHDGQGTAINPNNYPSTFIVMEVAA